MTYYDTADVARIFKVHQRTVQGWVRRREISHIRRGRVIRFSAEHIKEFEAAYTRTVPTDPIDVSAPNPDYSPTDVVVPMIRPGSAA